MGWGPCLIYSAPLLLPYIGATKTGWRAGLRIGFMFSLGRLISLVILGALATIVFGYINRFFPPHRSAYLYLTVAFSMIVLGVLIVLGKGFKIHLGKIAQESILNSGNNPILFIGFLVGICPCVPLVSVLTYIACVADNISAGILYALSFGTGTAVAPIILSTLMGGISEKVLRLTKHFRIFQIACGVVLILFGLELIYYVSYLIF